MAKDPSPDTPPIEYPMPQEGFRYVYNRTNAEYESMFDGRPNVFKAHEVKLLTTDRAEHLAAHSIIRGTLTRGVGGQLTSEHALALGPGWRLVKFHKQEGDPDSFGNDFYSPEYAEAEAEPGFLTPTETVPGAELFSPALSNYADRPSRDGETTTRRLLAV
jgi:hypothetical protein